MREADPLHLVDCLGPGLHAAGNDDHVVVLHRDLAARGCLRYEKGMPNALVTGTSTGIGEACALRLADLGWTVFAGVRRAEDGDRLKAQSTGDIRPVILDVSDRDDIVRVIADIEREMGPRGLQGLVNNAGVGVGGPIEYVTEEQWRWVFDVNFFGVVALTKTAIPLLRAGRGRIVHVGSIGGRVASPALGPYSASKFAIEALAEAQRHEFALSKTPIRVALIEPGEVKTAIWAKADTSADEAERALDDIGRQRYQWLIDQSRGFIDEGREKGVPAAKVADAIEHALTAKRPKARYLVGPDAKLSGHLVTRLPDPVRDALVRFGARRWETRGRKLRGGS
jgi:NAD(P)-dependent dehydrogenase (short-subunit alcohol dehydrogenase family)